MNGRAVLVNYLISVYDSVDRVDGPGVTNRSGDLTVDEVYCQHLVVNAAWSSSVFIDLFRHTQAHDSVNTGDRSGAGRRRPQYDKRSK